MVPVHSQLHHEEQWLRCLLLRESLLSLFYPSSMLCILFFPLFSELMGPSQPSSKWRSANGRLDYLQNQHFKSLLVPMGRICKIIHQAICKLRLSATGLTSLNTDKTIDWGPWESNKQLFIQNRLRSQMIRGSRSTAILKIKVLNRGPKQWSHRWTIFGSNKEYNH